MITIYLLTYNEEALLPFSIRFYRDRYKDNCKIIIYDNFSTDSTVKVALDLDCEVKQFYTNDKLSDQAFINVKNNCWKTAKTPWVIVTDADELVDIKPLDLEREEESSIIRTRFVQMVGNRGEINPNDLKNGILLTPASSKVLCFNKDKIEEINYSYGCHQSMPQGIVKFSKKEYIVFHYKYYNIERLIAKHKQYGSRLSKHNLKYKLSFHYLFSRRKIIKEFNDLCKQAIPIKKIISEFIS